MRAVTTDNQTQTISNPLKNLLHYGNYSLNHWFDLRHLVRIGRFQEEHRPALENHLDCCFAGYQLARFGTLLLLGAQQR